MNTFCHVALGHCNVIRILIIKVQEIYMAAKQTIIPLIISRHISLKKIFNIFSSSDFSDVTLWTPLFSQFLKEYFWVFCTIFMEPGLLFPNFYPLLHCGKSWEALCFIGYLWLWKNLQMVSLFSQAKKQK